MDYIGLEVGWTNELTFKDNGDINENRFGGSISGFEYSILMPEILDWIRFTTGWYVRKGLGLPKVMNGAEKSTA